MFSCLSVIGIYQPFNSQKVQHPPYSTTRNIYLNPINDNEPLNGKL